MQARDLLKKLTYEIIQGTDTAPVDGIAWDSRKVQPSSLFVCVRSRNVDRHNFAADAAHAGATTLVVEHGVAGVPPEVNIIKVENSRAAMAVIASTYFGEPSKYINLIGVTGTNGKTSVSWFIARILETCGPKPGIIGTIENRAGSDPLATEKINPTTPDSIELQQMFREMWDAGVNDITMEVTSEALATHRVDECHFDIAVFTNFSRDHLDLHGTMENYKQAKLKLFGMTRFAVINADDAIYPEVAAAAAGCEKIMTFGINNPADFSAEDIHHMLEGTRFTLNHGGEKTDMALGVPGKFSVYNALAAIGACHLLGLTMAQIANGIAKIEGVKGRFESIPNNKGLHIVIDYAHAPDGLENILGSVRELAHRRVITVFGCGGDRDRTKRPIMGEIAGRLSDLCILTSDNPRSEEPEAIIAEIEVGICETECPYEKAINRRDAIRRALDLAEPEDIVVIAGKGHETYQTFANYSIYFNDAEVVKEYFDGEAGGKK